MKELIKLIISLSNGLVSLALFLPIIMLFGLLGGIICSLIIVLPIYILFYLWGDIVIFLSSFFEPYFGNGGFIFFLVCILSFVLIAGTFLIISIIVNPLITFTHEKWQKSKKKRQKL